MPTSSPAPGRAELGYDPRPEQMDWRNTPIPRVNNPLPATPELVHIARRMWWNGDPWTILPQHSSVQAGNGVDVAHPVDILTGKLADLSNRRELRDYHDIASARIAVPGLLREAAELYLADSLTPEDSSAELAKTLLAYPQKVEYELPGELIDALAAFAGWLGDAEPPLSLDQGAAPG